ncbi:MAG: hypothetical protein CMB24_07155 [Euryarchaeota archaeon]|nr:hypothetical protein [Euryarchaeota archaeon]|tara:strand:- start:623 stop:1948 length:1326 start_codon:yes stop_codon:yes gene_type:complete
MAQKTGFPGVQINNGRIRIRISQNQNGKQTRLEFYMPGDLGIPTQTNLENASRLRKTILADIADKTTQFNKSVIEKTYFNKKTQQKIEPLAADSFALISQQWWKWTKAKSEKGIKGYKYSTVTGDKQIMNAVWLPLFGDLPINKISYDDVHKAVRNTNKEYMADTLRNHVSALKKVFTFADSELRIPIRPNPCADMTYPECGEVSVIKPEELKEPWRPVELAAVFKELEKEDLQVRAYFSVFRGTGMRTSEILALEINDIEDDDLWVTKGVVRGQLETNTKTWVNRRVYMQPQVLDIVNQLIERTLNKNVVNINRTDYIFQNENGEKHQSARYFNKRWRAAVNRARISREEGKKLYSTLKRRGVKAELIECYLHGKIPYRKPYKLRHTRASELVSRGVVEEGAIQLGHGVDMFIKRYAQQIKEMEDKKKDRSKLISEEKIS